jgi:hypothetical protein
MNDQCNGLRKREQNGMNQARNDEGVIAAVLLFGGKAHADDKEPSALVEIRVSVSWAVPEGTLSFGPAIGVDVTPIRIGWKSKRGLPLHRLYQTARTGAWCLRIV